MEQQIDISKLSVVELKSLAYDAITAINQAQSNLQLLNSEISNKIKLLQQQQEQSQTNI